MKHNPICIGTGLVALDVVISNDSNNSTQFYAGGSCGNVLTILSFLGWDSYPIARLSDNSATGILLDDLNKWQVKEDLLTCTSDGSTPIIIHRILKDKAGMPKHRFEFRNPEDGSYLPSYKPSLAKAVKGIVGNSPKPYVFYFDRINRASIELAKGYKAKGAIIFFEPSSMKDLKGFNECLGIADVVKFSHDRIANYDSVYPDGQVFLEIQTLGNEGLKFRSKNATEWTNLEGFVIDNVVDSAGAGDWCTAGVIMHIFDNTATSPAIEKDNIIFALQFGQALSALNCTFEGARGLMYNINRNELILSVQHIVNAHLKKIPQRIQPVLSYIKRSKDVKISSLLASH